MRQIAKMFTDFLHSKRKGVSGFSSILTHCNNLLILVRNSKVSLSKRQTNLVAHMLARTSRLHAFSHDFDCIHSHVLEVIINENEITLFPLKKFNMVLSIFYKQIHFKDVFRSIYRN